jgi:phage terminase Nu1 subunit (DNA packaging protein)
MAMTATTEQIAKLLCRDVRTVQRLAANGTLPRARGPDGEPLRGRFELIPTVQAFIHYLDDQLGLAALNDVAFRKERTGLVRVQRAQAELQFALFKGELHRAEDVEAVMNDLLSGIKMRLLAIPSKVTRLLIGQSSYARVSEVITEALHEALGDCTNYDARAFIGRNAEYLRANGLTPADLLEAEPSTNGEALSSE